MSKKENKTPFSPILNPEEEIKPPINEIDLECATLLMESKTDEIIEDVNLLDEVIEDGNLLRDNSGLIKNLKYKFLDNGFVNWCSMIDPQYIVFKDVNRTKENISEEEFFNTPNSEKVILLQGFKELCILRGVENISYQIIKCDLQHYAVKCTISFIPNFENDGMLRVSALGESHPNNCDFMDFGLNIAENRAFIRAVKTALNIPMYGKDEFGGKKNIISENNPYNYLKEILEKNKISFDNFKKRMISKNIRGSESWDSIEDIDIEIIGEIVSITRKILSKKNP
ncbi:MAG: hypothetical protein HC836_24185 [Richelia sp. RM2_1_2]|nr:hypothetical protein [Richelia sp. RM2_1_2]